MQNSLPNIPADIRVLCKPPFYYNIATSFPTSVGSESFILSYTSGSTPNVGSGYMLSAGFGCMPSAGSGSTPIAGFHSKCWIRIHTKCWIRIYVKCWIRIHSKCWIRIHAKCWIRIYTKFWIQIYIKLKMLFLPVSGLLPAIRKYRRREYCSSTCLPKPSLTVPCTLYMTPQSTSSPHPSIQCDLHSPQPY